MNTQAPIQTRDPRLDLIASKLVSVDRHLVHLLARRNRLAAKVAMIKLEAGDPLIYLDIEKKRQEAVAEWAEKEDVDPRAACAMHYQFIGESCKSQAKLADKHRVHKSAEKFNPTQEELRGNLMQLTAKWAPEYDSYGEACAATLALREYENQAIDRAISQAPDSELGLDLGCATALVSRRIRGKFARLQGYDISPEMIEVGYKALALDATANIDLDVQDIETGIPLPSKSVSTVIMNGGTGSDLFDLDTAIQEIKRVLKPQGTFMLSFYNRDAWTQKTFFPWPLGLAACVDADRNCLEVIFKKELFAIHAKLYTTAEIEEKLGSRHMTPLVCNTYPMLSSILPSDIANQSGIKEMLNKLDGDLAQNGNELGTYIVVTGKKE
jgi:SAM-dependent methyltransferase/chorismate mutase